MENRLQNVSCLAGSNHLALFQESIVRRGLLQVVFPDALEGDIERYPLLRGQIPAIPYLK